MGFNKLWIPFEIVSCSLNFLIQEGVTKTLGKGAENPTEGDVGNPGSVNQLLAEMLQVCVCLPVCKTRPKLDTEPTSET